MTTTHDETSALILAGDGYQLTIAPEAEARKETLITLSTAVVVVTNNGESSQAQFVSRKLAAMRIEVEKSRKAVKEPVNRIGKLIDQTAANFLHSLEIEEDRIKRLVGAHAMEVALAKEQKAVEERKAFEAARAAREEAARAEEAAELASAQKQRVGAIAAALRAAAAAVDERLATLAARMEASADVAGTKIADGVRFAWDFEVTDIHTLAERRWDLVTVEPKRSAILGMLKVIEDRGEDAVEFMAALGIKAFKKPVVSSR